MENTFGDPATSAAQASSISGGVRGMGNDSQLSNSYQYQPYLPGNETGIKQNAEFSGIIQLPS